MCGIWGFFPDNGKMEDSDFGLIDQLMTITSLRGKDSTGVAVIHEVDKRARTLKMVGGPDILLNTDAWAKIQDFATKKGTAMFGHGRFGTKGAAVAKNAHPHTVDHITMVHNGTIHYGLEEAHKEAGTDNDSLALTHAIAKHGIVDAMSECEFGAYAVIIHDAQQGKVFFIRNEERPLHMIRYNQASIIMSEAKALEYLVERNSHYQKPQISYFAKNMIYSIDLRTNKFETDDSLVEKIAKKFRAPAPYVPPTTHSGAQGTATTPTGGSTGKNGNVHIKRNYPAGYPLMLVMSEKMSKGTDYRLTFMDDENKSIYSYTRWDCKDRLGCEAICYQLDITRMSDGKEFIHTTYKELKWPNETKAPEVKQETMAEQAKEEDSGRSARFRNNIAMSPQEARDILGKHDCALCQGVVRESEIPETIMMSNKQMICPDCIRQGKHFSFGFGQ